MFSSFRNRFGIPGVISVIALVFAMVGGAFAANNLGDSSNGATASAKKKKKAKKAKRGPRGPRGATGPAGPAGAQGPAGPAGAKGDTGAAGANGSAGATGATGANGQGVTTDTEPPFGECGEQDGVEITSASGTSYVCNGAPGAKGATGATGTTGPEGSPWTAGGTLPSGKTLTGVWTLGVTVKPSPDPVIHVPISFALPLASELSLDQVNSVSQVHFLFADGSEYNELTEELIPSVHCTGTAAAPKADAGHLCIYTTSLTGAFAFNSSIAKPGAVIEGGAGTMGAKLAFNITTSGAAGWGTWAVTAP